MIKTLPLISASINFALLFVISTLHFYWVFGKSSDFTKIVPTNLEGKQVLRPTKIDCLIVALFLLAFSVLFLVRVGLLTFHLPSWLFRYGVWSISGIFLLRAIGDFNYVGFTKKKSTTAFAKMDTMYYSPLCVLLGLNGILIEVFS